MNDFFTKILHAGKVVDGLGNEVALHSNIDASEGKMLNDVIRKDESIQKTLEVGCAYGLSSLSICDAIAKRKSPQHTIIDPYQSTQWKGIGVLNLKRAGFNFFNLIEEKSEYALPAVTKKEEGQFDFVFIDGWHTFDHTLLDFFYANKLIRVGGYIAIDDCSFASISRVISYVLKYPAYRVHSSVVANSSRQKTARLTRMFFSNKFAKLFVPKKIYDLQHPWTNMVILKKIAEDKRDWAWFEDF